MRNYWMPIGLAAELTAESPKKRVRVLGENLVLFRDAEGRIGLVEEQCRHRRASLYYGFVEDDGLRCPYHGWKFDVTGRCIEQPFEKRADGPRPEGRARRPIRCNSSAAFYLPIWAKRRCCCCAGRRWRAATASARSRCCRSFIATWLQAQENSVDPVHTYYLHGHRLKMQGKLDRRTAYYLSPDRRL